MATQLIMPKLGMAMKEGTVVKWLKEDGAEVKKGEAIVVVMTKKITYKVEAPADGILRHVARPKDVRGIGEVIGFITAPGEPIPEVEVVAPAPALAPAPAAVPSPAAPAVAKVEAPKEFIPSSPAARYSETGRSLPPPPPPQPNPPQRLPGRRRSRSLRSTT